MSDLIGNFNDWKEASSERPANDPRIVKWYGEPYPIGDVRTGQKVTYKGMKFFVHDGSDVHLLLHKEDRNTVMVKVHKQEPVNDFVKVNQSMFNAYCILWDEFDKPEVKHEPTE